MSGYTLSHRDKWSNPVFRNLLEAGIWSWLCDAAVWKETRVRHSGRLVKLKRGQLVVSERFVANGFECGRQIIRTFLDNVETDQMITREVTQGVTIITICNYDKYQIDINPTNPLDNPSLTQDQPKPNPNKKEANKSNKDNIYHRKFFEFWDAFPKRAGANPKTKAAEKFQTACKRTDPEKIITGAKRYAAMCEADGSLGTKFVAQAVTWLSQERWDDDPPPNPIPKPKEKVFAFS